MPVYKCNNGKWKIGKDGECRFSSKQKAENAFDHWIETKEESIQEDDLVDSNSDTVTMDHSFLLRLMELMRENNEISDVNVHEIADRIIETGKEKPVTMDDYGYIIGDLDPEKSGYGDETYEDQLLSPEEPNDSPDRETDDGKKELEELIRKAGMKGREQTKHDERSYSYKPRKTKNKRKSSRYSK